MIRKIMEYLTYKSNVRALKKYAVATVVDFVKGKEDYLNAIRKIASSLKDIESVDEIKQIFIHELVEIAHESNAKNMPNNEINEDSENESEQEDMDK